MAIVRLTGSQLHAARALAGISRETLAERAGVYRYSILKWENSSNATPQAMYQHICRAVSVIENAGVVLTETGGVEPADVTLPSDAPARSLKSVILNAGAVP